MAANKEASKLRELFIEEMAQVQAGAAASSSLTTAACCEEGPFGCCHILPIDPFDLLRP